MDDARIETVEPIRLSASLDRSFGYAQGWVDSRTATLVRIEASDGTVGWGECFGPPAGTSSVIEELLAPALVGENPHAVERCYDRCYDLTRREYQTTVPLPAISGVDIALWDLRGRLTDRSVAGLLGGRRRDSVRAYATGHYFRPTEDLSEQYAAIVEEAVSNASSVGALKLKLGLSVLGYGPDEDMELVQRVVDAVPVGTSVMVDANYAYDRPTAGRVGGELGAMDVEWFEEPIAPEDEEGYRLLQRASPVPIAGGECLTPAAFDRLLGDRALDIVQPDVCAVGGLTPARRIATRTHTSGDATFVPHVWGTPIAQAASLQLLATVASAPWIEWDRSPHPFRDAVVRSRPRLQDGRVPVPEGPGLGVRPDEDALEAFAT